MKQVPYRWPANITGHRIKFSRPGDLALQEVIQAYNKKKDWTQLQKETIIIEEFVTYTNIHLEWWYTVLHL
jgi:hypothetical protein